MTNKKRTCDTLMSVVNNDKQKENELSPSCRVRRDVTMNKLDSAADGIAIPLAKCMADNYYNGNGSEVILKKAALDKSLTIKELSTRNINRLEKTFVGQGDKNTAELLRKLPVGESVEITDHWDAVAKAEGMTLAKKIFDIPTGDKYYNCDRDTFLAIGSVQLGSDFTGTAKRSGNTININGTIQHSLFDVYDYDYNYKKPFYNETRAVKEGCAKTYPVKAVWKEGIVGSVKIDEKGLGNPIVRTYSLEEEE
ncbi:MAG: hypothetical protein IKD08_01020 [Alphaproteobacteria bacterium]|nr:hypothetical protein [Alphaproteobacteria bacterium]